jgi:hypothetical protein
MILNTGLRARLPSWLRIELLEILDNLDRANTRIATSQPSGVRKVRVGSAGWRRRGI